MPKRERRCYPTNYATDVTDEQWAMIAPLVTTVSAKGGRPPDIDLRAIVHALDRQKPNGVSMALTAR